MRIALTGGAGFIGSHLCDYLIALGHDIICIDNEITGRRTNIRHLENNRRFTLIEQDVTKFIAIDGELDYVLHFASPASPFAYQKLPIQTLKAGALGTHNALGLAKAKEARFLLASTSEVYGDPQVNPQSESYWGNVNQLGPRGVYDEAKRFAESLTTAYHKVHGMDCKIVRIFNTYGPRMKRDDGRVVPAFINQALNNAPLTVFGDGSQKRSFCYISDLIEGIYRLMLSDLNEPVNLGNPVEISILEFARKVIELTGAKCEIVFQALPEDDPKTRCPDISRAKNRLHWQPEVDLEEGLKLTIDWFTENPERAKRIDTSGSV